MIAHLLGRGADKSMRTHLHSGGRDRKRIPIRGTFADRSVPAIASVLTRVMIDPTVRQATPELLTW